MSKVNPSERQRIIMDEGKEVTRELFGTLHERTPKAHSEGQEMLTEIEQDYRLYWKDIVEKPDGSLDVEQVKKELFDFHAVIEEVSKAYDAITGGKFSKPLTAHDYIIQAVDDCTEKAIEDRKQDEGWLSRAEHEAALKKAYKDGFDAGKSYLGGK